MGYFRVSTGAAASLMAATGEQTDDVGVRAIDSRRGRPYLADPPHLKKSRLQHYCW
jgi:hypothetical protein